MDGNSGRTLQVPGPVPKPATPAYREQVSMRGGSQDALSICMSQSEYNGISMPVLGQKSWKCLACPPSSPQPLCRFRRGRLTEQKRKCAREFRSPAGLFSSCFQPMGGPTLEAGSPAETAETRPPGLERHDHDQTGLSSAAQVQSPSYLNYARTGGRAARAGGRWESKPAERAGGSDGQRRDWGRL